MVSMRFGPDDLIRVRFARSPMMEVINSLRLLLEPGPGHPARGPGMFRPWLSTVPGRVAGLDLSAVLPLIGDRLRLPDFLVRPPDRAEATIAEQLDQLRATPPERVHAALEELRNGRPLAPELHALRDDPEPGLDRIAGQLAAYWDVALEPYWPRIRALTDADLAYRAAALTRGGVAEVFATLHPGVEYQHQEGTLHIRQWSDCEHELRGLGLLLVPCVFAWPGLNLIASPPYQPVLGYPPRGIAELWSGASTPAVAPFGELLGRSRATLLAHLDLPLSTTQLAMDIGVTPAAVSQHLSVLRRCGLVTSRRAGRTVLYQRTPLATELLSQSYA
ncbi:DUF5937 family protein [Longispora albida]|uniref:DUF5937 family protein n=1 Tax=Longispora albida TaxID=203523 RepID=UPI000375B6EC|nr:DUF5937 family protein [Longispora albida]